jgi:hypothetical protein
MIRSLTAHLLPTHCSTVATTRLAAAVERGLNRLIAHLIDSFDFRGPHA